MFMGFKQYDQLTDYAQQLVDTSWRTTLLIRKPEARAWLAKTACEGIVSECNNASDYSLPGLQDALRERVYDYVVKANTVQAGNGDYGFVIASILLAAVLGWLIQKLLDHLFPNV